jgi:hypothetical protein
VVEGRNPVSKAVREGWHHGAGACALEKVTERTAKRSRLGVFAAGNPMAPIHGRRSSTAMKSTLDSLSAAGSTASDVNRGR